VSGWDYTHWLDTSRWAGRLTAVNVAVGKRVLDSKTYPLGIEETASEALTHALTFWGGPELSDVARRHLLDLGRMILRGQTESWQQVPQRILRQNTLRSLIPMTPDFQTA
jgi:hypothetical protein